MLAKEMWDEFIKKFPQHKDRSYEAWPFGGGPESADDLARLVLEGKKTATASAYPMYEFEKEAIPTVDGLDIILDSKGQAVCVIETKKVYLKAFKDVDENHAYLEGEGDRSLNYWRQVHEDFFKAELATINKNFTPEMKVVCEEFQVIYK